MCGFFRRRKDRSYSVKLKRTSYAKLGLLAERLDTSETDTLEGIIDFALANYGTGAKTGLGGVDLASLISGGEGSPDVLDSIIAQFGPQIAAKFLGGANPGGSTGDNASTQPADLNKKLSELLG